MKEEAIEVRYARRRRKYSSYIGEITPAVDDLVKRNFHAGVPNALWLTDISEFAASDGKVYLSPLIDCFDGKLVSWATSKHPDSALVEEMLDRAFAELGCTDDRLPGLVIHTDRGGHYRGGEWIERLEGKGIVRSISRKGNSGGQRRMRRLLRTHENRDVLRPPLGEFPGTGEGHARVHGLL